MHVFVYGTLRPGGQHWASLSPWVRAVGATGVLDGHHLFAGPAYPLAAPAPAGWGPATGVVGEAVEVDDSAAGEVLEHLDAVEGAPELFRRVQVAGMWLYLATAATLLEVAGQAVASGDWFDVEPSARGAWERALAMPYGGPTCRYGPP